MSGPPAPLEKSRPFEFDWSLLVSHFVSPVKVIIIESMLWVQRPLSATELEKLACGTPELDSFSWHLKSLAELAVLEPVAKRKVSKSKRLSQENFFYFAGQHGWAVEIARRRDPHDHLTKVALRRAAR